MEIRRARNGRDLTWRAQEVHGRLPYRLGLAYLISAPLGPERTGQLPDDIVLNPKIIDILIRITRR